MKLHMSQVGTVNRLRAQTSMAQAVAAAVALAGGSSKTTRPRLLIFLWLWLWPTPSYPMAVPFRLALRCAASSGGTRVLALLALAAQALHTLVADERLAAPLLRAVIAFLLPPQRLRRNAGGSRLQKHSCQPPRPPHLQDCHVHGWQSMALGPLGKEHGVHQHLARRRGDTHLGQLAGTSTRPCGQQRRRCRPLCRWQRGLQGTGWLQKERRHLTHHILRLRVGCRRQPCHPPRRITQSRVALLQQ